MATVSGKGLSWLVGIIHKLKTRQAKDEPLKLHFELVDENKKYFEPAFKLSDGLRVRWPHKRRLTL